MVLVNDFGAIDIDSQLQATSGTNSISLKNGCICCNLQNDLVSELQGLLNNPEGRPEYIVIETSGVSDPSKIVNALRYPQIRDQFQISAVLTLINAETLGDLNGEVKHLAMSQLDAADIVVINKVDIVNRKKIDQIHEDWLFPAARVLETTYADVPMELLFERDFTLGREDKTSETNTASHDHRHLFESYSWSCDKSINLDRLRAVINQLPREVYRAKGICNTDKFPSHRVILQMVGTREEWTKEELAGNHPKNELVLISLQNSIDWAHIKQNLDACVT